MAIPICAWFVFWQEQMDGTYDPTSVLLWSHAHVELRGRFVWQDMQQFLQCRDAHLFGWVSLCAVYVVQRHMLDGWYLCVPCTLYNGTYLTWGVMSALNMQSSDIYLLLVFLAFAPSFWQDCEMKSWTANTCIPSGVFAFFSHLRHQNEKTNLHFFIQFFFLPEQNVCVIFLWWLDRKTPRPEG